MIIIPPTPTALSWWMITPRCPRVSGLTGRSYRRRSVAGGVELFSETVVEPLLSVGAAGPPPFFLVKGRKMLCGGGHIGVGGCRWGCDDPSIADRAVRRAKAM